MYVCHCLALRMTLMIFHSSLDNQYTRKQGISQRHHDWPQVQRDNHPWHPGRVFVQIQRAYIRIPTISSQPHAKSLGLWKVELTYFIRTRRTLAIVYSFRKLFDRFVSHWSSASFLCGWHRIEGGGEGEMERWKRNLPNAGLSNLPIHIVQSSTITSSLPWT